MKTLLVILITFISVSIFANDGKKVESKVTEATVFKNRAMVTRKAEVDFSKGTQKIIISNLTTNIDDASVRVAVDGDGIIKILDVKVERRFTTEIQQDAVKDLQRQIDLLNIPLGLAIDQIDILESKQQLVHSIKAQLPKVYNEKMMLNIGSTKNWTDMLSFVENNLNEIFTGLRKQNAKRESIINQISVLKSEIIKHQGGTRKSYKEIIVTAEGDKPGKIKFYPSYIVQNASWYPLYDVRVDSKIKNAEWHYYGMIQQSTGEDWKDIKLILSTAEPLSSKTLPEIDTWFLNSSPLPVKNQRSERRSSQNSNYPVDYEQNWGIPAGKGTITGYITDKQSGEPLISANVIVNGTNLGSATDFDGKFYLNNVSAGVKNINIAYVGYQRVKVNLEVVEKHIAHIDVALDPSVMQVDEISVVGERFFTVKATSTSKVVSSDEISQLPARGVNKFTSAQAGIIKDLPDYTNIYAKELSTVFEVPAKSDIPSSNTPRKVTIAIENMPITFEYTSIPKIFPGVYLKGKIVNNQSYLLLEGELNVFVDNDFINRTNLNTVVASDTFNIALGIDEKLKIKKKSIKRFQESTGLFGGGRRITYEYEIEVLNNRSTDETILVLDQLPIALNEEIKIELIIPEIDEKQIRKDGKLEWKFDLKAGGKKVIPLKFQVDFPNSLYIYGLE